MSALFIDIFVIGRFLCLFLIRKAGIPYRKHRIIPRHGIGLFQYPSVAVPFPVTIGQEHSRVRPSHASPRSIVHHLKPGIGNHRRDYAVRQFPILHVPHPFPEKRGCVHYIGPRIKEDLRIPRPAKPFPGGAVSGNIQEIALHAPDRIFKEAVDQVIGACKGTGPFHIGIDGYGFKILRLKFCIRLNERIPEAEHRKPCLIKILSSGAGEQYFLFRRRLHFFRILPVHFFRHAQNQFDFLHFAKFLYRLILLHVFLGKFALFI